MPVWRPILLAVLVALAATGCNRGPGLLRIYGTVTVDGQPVEKGTIEFIPIEGTHGPSTGGSITDGKYDVAARLGPLEGGTYQVQITGMRKTGKTTANIFQPGGPPLELEDNFIPAKYNRESTLKATITAETAKDGLDFHLKSSG